MNSPKPLDNFPLIRSRNVDEVCEAIGRVYARPVLLPSRGAEGFDTTFNNCRLRNVGLAYGSYGAAVDLEFPPAAFFSLLFPIRGCGEIASGETSVAIAAGNSVVLPAGQTHKVRLSLDYEHLVLRFDATALADKLKAITETALDRPLQMALQQSPPHPAGRMLRRYVPHLVDTLSAATPPFPDWWVAQTEQFLMVLFLCSHQHNYSHLLDENMATGALQKIRQAENYIEANVERAVTLDELAKVTGVSPFGLFHLFRKKRGYSPLEFIARLRAKRGGEQ